MSAFSSYVPRSNQYASSPLDINILMMGETGAGKSTFINAFANYIIHSTLNEAIRGEMQILIPSAFHTTDQNSFNHEPKQILIGKSSDDEKCGEIGQSSTQVCHSYVFPIENRILRLIDAPGVGDVRGVEQDENNCEHILAYLNQYEHLNGICILLKPNNERLTVGFRFSFKQILTHLHINAKDNLMFIFTNGRTTFYRPGSTTPLIRCLLKEVNETWKVEVPFNKGNTFIFDNEAFRFLALNKNGMRFSTEEHNCFSKSWDISVAEFIRLIKRILQCELHAVRDSLSINAAQQLIRQLTRPIGEIARLIEENIQLAKQYKQNVIQNPLSILPKQIPQKQGKVVEFDYPRTVCTSKNCTQIIIVNNERKVDYITKCHPQCYLRDIERECIGHLSLQFCDAMNKLTGICTVCRCRWDQHMHIAYEYETFITYVNIDSTSTRSSLTSIDKRIDALRQEEASILQVCHKLSQFLRHNAIAPYNDDILEYIRYYVREEEMKRSAGANNADVIQGLQNMIDEYERVQVLFNKSLSVKTAFNSTKNIIEPEGIFDLVAELYQLPINGRSIQEQIERLKEKQVQINGKKEHVVKIPFNANSTMTMRTHVAQTDRKPTVTDGYRDQKSVN